MHTRDLGACFYGQKGGQGEQREFQGTASDSQILRYLNWLESEGKLKKNILFIVAAWYSEGEVLIDYPRPPRYAPFKEGESPAC